MKITIDNYQQVFDELETGFSRLEQSKNNNVKETFRKIREKVGEVRAGGDALRQENAVLKIGIVGQVKAGKSSFLNSLFFNGENVLPKASTPMTAGLTILQYGERNEFEVEYYNTYEWKSFEDKAKTYDDIVESYRSGNPSLTDEEAAKEADIDPQYVAAKELVSNCGRNVRMQILETSKKETKPFSGIADLQDTLEKYVGAGGAYTPIVKCLTIRLHDERLKDVQIVDTPGVNDPVLSREQRTREFLRGCHGVFFLSYSGRFFDSTDVSFLTDRIGSQGIGEVVLIGSKFDSVLQDVGMKYRDDLGSAIDYCQRALKKQYDTNISASEFQGKDPRLDFSSGIGFSIAQKDEKRWDDMERHVVKQMQNFYPSFFSSLQDVKETFLNLSQISDIREKYVEHMFKDRKDEIIQSKVNAYFSNSNANLKKIIESEWKRLYDKTKLLRTTEVDEVGKKKEALGKLVERIKNNMNSLANRMDNVSGTAVKECLNAYSLEWDGRIPTAKVDATFYRKSTSWGRKKTFKCSYEKVNLQRLTDMLNTALTNAIDDLSKNWKEKAREIRESIASNIAKIIRDSEKQDTDSHLDGYVLNNIVGETLAAMENQSTLEINKIKDKSKKVLTDNLTRIDCVNLNIDIGKKKEDEAKALVAGEADMVKEKVRSAVEQWKSFLYLTVTDEIRKAGEDSISVLKDKKDEFINKVKEQTDDVLTRLEEELRDKTTNLQLLEEALNELKKIENKL